MVIISATGDAGEVATYTREGQVLVHVSRLRTVANDYQPVSGSGVVYTFDGTGGSMADCVTDTLGEP
jgi:hypothetical protein